MGADYAAQVEAKLPIVQDAAVNGYLTVLGDSLAGLTGVHDLTWRFRLVNSAEVNAYSIAGGYVYVTRGLVARTATMNQFAGVVGHEIAHVVRRHMVGQLERSQRTDLAITLGCVLTGVCGSEAARVGIDVGAGAMMASYSREDEAEADRDAVHLLARAGIDPRGLPSMFEVLIAERKVAPRGVDAWFATHPTEESRIVATRRELAAYPVPRLDAMRVTSRAFDDFRARVGRLPATTAGTDSPASP